MEYGLIGERLPHSFSKEIHEKIGDYEYSLVELKPDEVDNLLKEYSKGINVDYKELVSALVGK